MAYVRSVLALALIGAGCLHAEEEGTTATPAELAREIQRTAAKGDLAEAEEQFAAAVEAHPDALEIQGMRMFLHAQHMQKGNMLRAAEHLGELLKFAARNIGSDEIPASVFDGVSEEVVRVYEAAGAVEKGRAALRAALEALPDDAPKALVARTQLRGALIVWDTSAETLEETRKELDELIATARRKYEADGEDASAAMRLVAALAIETSYREKLEETRERIEEARKAHRDLLRTVTQKHAADREVLQAYVQNVVGIAMESMQVDAEATDSIIAEAREVFASIEEPSDEIRSLVSRAERFLLQIEARLQGVRLHQSLIGTAAPKIEPAAWVNGSAPEEGELEGKVLLLDFWAVWCGPCIAAFPHLKEWNERFSESGLEIVGVTDFYGYSWNEESGRPQPNADADDEEAAHEAEKEMLEKFADSHGLEYRFAVMPEGSDFSDKFGVQGIPQLVVIDREGKIRMIRVGAGEGAAKDVEGLLEELLGQGKAPEVEESDG